MTIWENIFMQRSSIWHVLPSLWCFKFKEGGWMAKAGSFKPRLVSWFKLWKKCIMLVQFTTSFTTCHGVSFSFLVYMGDSLVSWTSFPDQLSVCVPKQDPPVICFNRELRANVSIVGGFTSYEQIFKACSRPKAYASYIGTYSVPSKLWFTFHITSTSQAGKMWWREACDNDDFELPTSTTGNQWLWRILRLFWLPYRNASSLALWLPQSDRYCKFK